MRHAPPGISKREGAGGMGAKAESPITAQTPQLPPGQKQPPVMRLGAIGRSWRCSLRRRGRRTRATSGMMMKTLPPMPKGNTSGLSAGQIAILRAGQILLVQYCYLYSCRILARSAKLSKRLLSIPRQLQFVLERKCYQPYQVPKRYLRRGCYHPAHRHHYSRNAASSNSRNAAA